MSTVEVDGNANRKLQEKNSALAEVKIHGASLLFESISIPSRNHIDSWIRRRPTHPVLDTKFGTLLTCTTVEQQLTYLILLSIHILRLKT